MRSREDLANKAASNAIVKKAGVKKNLKGITADQHTPRNSCIKGGK